MGLVASNGRLLMLTARDSDIEYRVQAICQQRMNLAMNIGNVYQGDLNTDTSNMNKSELDRHNAQINAQVSVFQARDKALELEQKNLETQHQAIQTEIESVKKVIDKNIEMSFKYFA